tara:strand:- start:189 stop:407 length:219 start_codon:yes stop_codon:yes gene_type:complete
MTELPGMPEDEETQLAEVRAVRDDLLFASDYTQAADDPTGNASAWATYRQELRDFPATWTPSPTADFPDPPA